MVGAQVLLMSGATNAAAVRPLDADWHRGAVVPAYHARTYVQPESDRALRALRRTGSTHVTLFFHWFMDGARSSSVHPDRQQTPTNRSIRHAIRKAHSLGMSVTLSPIARPYDDWQGTIRPRNRDRWFRSYRAMIDHYARLAERGGVELLTIGGELRTMSRYTRDWRRVLASAREVFSEELTYLANHTNEAEEVKFWPQLDYVAISAYMALSDRAPNPTVRKLVRAWERRGYVRAIRDLHTRVDRPVLFGEVGYQSRMGTAIAPWEDGSGRISQTPQRRAYEALYRVWSRYSWFDGVYWWKWMPGRYAPRDGTHSPRGKRAEDTMRAWNTARP